MSTSQTRTQKRSSQNGLRSALTGACLLVVSACGGDAGMTPSNSTTAGSGTPPTTTPSAGSTGGAAGTPATGGAAGSKAPGAMTGTPKAGAGAPTTGAAGAATAGTGTGTGTAGAGAAGSGTAGAPDTTAAGSGTAGSTGGPTTPSEGSGESSCLDGLDNFDQEGPFEYTEENEGRINYWVPKVPEGCKVPVIHLSNGTGATCGSYGQALVRFATWGFLTACYEDGNTGAGQYGLEALQTAMTKYPNLAAKKYGSTGHSQGGQASFIVLQLAEEAFGVGPDTKFAGLAMQPASGFGSQPSGGTWQSIYAKIKSPMFMFSGQGTDGLVSQGWVQSAFDNLDKGIEAYFWAKAGGMHIPTPQGEEMQIGPAWFRWKLLGDQKACMFFKSIPMSDNTWEEVAVQNAADCQ